MTKSLVRELTAWNEERGDRMDPVAIVCRRLFLRVELCPCMQNPPCDQCAADEDAIVRAWGGVMAEGGHE